MCVCILAVTALPAMSCAGCAGWTTTPGIFPGVDQDVSVNLVTECNPLGAEVNLTATGTATIVAEVFDDVNCTCKEVEIGTTPVGCSSNVPALSRAQLKATVHYTATYRDKVTGPFGSSTCYKQIVLQSVQITQKSCDFVRAELCVC